MAIFRVACRNRLQAHYSYDVIIRKLDNFQLKLLQYAPQKDFDFLITQVDSNDNRNQNNYKTQASRPEFQIQNLSDTPQGTCHA